MGRLFLVVVPVIAIAAAVLGSIIDALVPTIGVGLVLGLGAALVIMRSQAVELAEERVRSERLLEELPLSVVLFSEGGVAYANRAARQVFGLHESDGRIPAEAIGSQVLVDAVEEADEVPRPIDVEIQQGEQLLAARASRLASGEVVLVVRDVTGARRLDAVRRDFVLNASHELKTPVAGIQALAESLELALRHDPQRAVRMVTRIEHEAGRLARLVRDLLDLARLEENGQHQRRRVDLAGIVQAQIDRMQPLADERGISIKAVLEPPTHLVAVPEDLRIIVANLLENAVRYNRDGGEVTVTVQRSDQHVTLEVADTGMGIPEQDQDRIFERFYRIDKARSRAAGGTGLGLSLVRHATERHGGHIKLSSALGRGSCFRVELPVASE